MSTERTNATTVRIAAVQTDVRLGAPRANLERIGRWMEDPRVRGASLVVFPECAVSGYCFPDRASAWSAAQPIPGPATDTLCRLAGQHDCYLIAGMLERGGRDLYNAAVLVGPQGLVHRYRKTHLPFLGADKFTSPGKQPPPVVDVGFLRIGLHICYDGSFPEVGRTLMLEGADVAVLPTNWPHGAEKYAELLAPMRALENHYFFMAVNRVGAEGGFRFLGQSKIATPTGHIIASAGPTEQTVLTAEIDPERARSKKIERVPGEHAIDRIADRRPELYGSLVAPMPKPVARR